MKPIEDEFRQAPEEWKHGQRGHLRIESMAKLLSEPEPPLEWLIENLWTDKSRGLIAGHPGVGKTWIALDMLLAVCTGGLCMNKFQAAYKAPCLLIEEEASRLNLARRIHALARARGLKDTDLQNLFHITRQFAKVPRDTQEISEIVKANKIKLVVFDSLRRFHSAKENSSDEMQAILDSFAVIGIVGQCSIILIHHLSKSGSDNDARKPIFERMRGTGDLWAWRDCILGIEGEEDADICKCSFQFRDAEAIAPIQIKRYVGASTGAVSLEAISVVDSEDFQTKCQQAREFIQTQFGEAYLTAIAEALPGRKSDNLKAVKLMVKEAVFVANGNGKLRVPD